MSTDSAMTDASLQLENEELRRQLEEARETLEAIRSGAVDAFVVEGAAGHQVYTLEGAERPYRILVERMQQGAVTLDGSGSIVYCNARFADLVGGDHQLLIGGDFRRLITPDDRPDFAAQLQKIAGGSSPRETCLQRADGTSVPVLLAFNTLPDDCGASYGMLVTDLTAQRHHEKLNAALELLRVTLASIGDAVITTDIKGRIDYLNDVAEKLTGWTRQAAAGRNLEDVFQIIQEASREPAESTVTAALRDGQIVGATGHTLLIARNGAECPIDDRASPIRDEQGNIWGAVLVFRDVTERRLAEESVREAKSRLESTLVAGEIGTWEFDVVNNAVRADRNLARMFGVSSELAAGGPLEAFLEAIHPDDRDRVTHDIGQALNEGDIYETDYRIRDAEGVLRWVVARGRIERNDAGQAVRLPGVVVDITGERQAEQRFRASEERLQLALRAGRMGTWDLDLNTGHLTSSETCKANYGRAPHETFTYENLAASVLEEDRDRWRSIVQQAAAHISDFDVEYRVRWPDGTLHWVFVRGSCSADAAGKAVAMSGVSSNIDERKNAEEALQASEERRRLALDAAELGAWNVAPATNELKTDQRFRIIFTGTADPIDYEQAFGCIHPDDRERIRDAVAAATRPEDPEPYAAEFRVIHRDSSIHWVFGKGRASFEETVAGRRLTSFDGTVADITERVRAEEALRESEARFRQLADAIPQLAWTADAQGNLDWYNSRWFEYTGTTREQMQGWGWESLHHPDVLPQVLERWKRSLAHGEPFNMAFPLKGADGEYRTFLTKVMPFHDDGGRVIRWFGTNTDISEQQQLQDELRRIAGELSEAGRRKDEFLATLAHELRNPLSPIKSATQLMQMIGDDVTQFRELGHVIDRQVQQMVRLIDDLLDISRISRGKITLQREPSDLREVVRTALEATAPFIEKSGHELHVENSGDPLIVLGDPARLSQILVNLLNNAAKYTPAPGTISISLIHDNGQALIRVRDNGLGISSDDLSRVFEMFEQLNVEKQRGQAGLGIGLSLVKNLVELHDGEVNVDSEGRGHGSMFSVRLPLLSDHTSTTTTTNDKQAGDPAPSHSFRVLVVEDIRANRAMLVRLLQMMGHEVAEAADGREGLEIALSFQPDVILSDISMPKMNGHEMASEIRKTDQLKEVRMIALTGYGQTADRDYAKASGFDGYMVKPADAATLANYFSELADKQNLANR